MNTDHINYQQQINQSVIEEKDREMSEKMSTGQLSISSSMIEITPLSTSSNVHYQQIEADLQSPIHTLTPLERRQRILTLLMIAFVAFLTGRRLVLPILYLFLSLFHFPLGVDYAIILPTAWGYINTFMQFHYAGFVMGALLSVFALSGAVAGLVLGYLNDNGVSLKRLVLFGILFKIIGNILYLIGINIYIVILSRLIAGIGMGLVVSQSLRICNVQLDVFPNLQPPLLAEISRQSTAETRTQLLSKVLGKQNEAVGRGSVYILAKARMSTNRSSARSLFHHSLQTDEFHISRSPCDDVQLSWSIDGDLMDHPSRSNDLFLLRFTFHLRT